VAQLREALTKFGVQLSLKELKQVWTAADKDASSNIDFDEVQRRNRTRNRAAAAGAGCDGRAVRHGDAFALVACC
jgi:hypothetical protein